MQRARRATRNAARLSVLLGTLTGWIAVAPAGADRPRLVVGRDPAIFQQDPNAVALRVGAWLDASYVDNDLEPGSVDLNHFNVLFDARWRPLQAFLEMEYEREVDRYGAEEEEELEIEQAFLRYRPRDWLSLRLGRFNTPAGIWFPIHWSILMDTIQEPPHAAKDLLPEQQVGLEVSGRLFPGRVLDRDAQLEYAVFAGIGGERIDQDDVEGVSFGADLRLLLAEDALVGVTAYRQHNDAVADRSEQSFLVYGEARLPGALTFRSEYLHQRRERDRGAPWDRTLDVVYAKLRWDFWRWFYANYRVSYGDDDGEDLRTERQIVNTFTLGIVPHPAVLVKLEYSSHELTGSRDDFNFWGASFGVRF